MLDNLTINDLPEGVVDVVEVIGCLLYTSSIICWSKLWSWSVR